MEAYTTSNVYEFCLDWQMQGEARDIHKLKKDFDSMCISYAVFKTIAMKYKWFVKSMEILAE